MANNAFQNLAAGIRRFFTGDPRSKTPYPIVTSSSLHIYPDVDAEKAIRLGYQSNATVNTIVRTAGRKFGSIPCYLFNDDQSPAAKKAKTHHALQLLLKGQTIPYASRADMSNPQIIKLNNLLQRPNKKQGQDAFRASIYQYKLLTGEAFVYCNRGFTVDGTFRTYDANGLPIDDLTLDRMPIVNMEIIPSDKMVLVPDQNDWFDILGWKLQSNGEQTFYRKNDIIHWKNESMDFDIHTRSHLRGVSPLKSGGALLQQNAASQVSATRNAQNNGAGGLLSLDVEGPDSLAPGQADAIRGVIDKRINNNDVSGQVAFLMGKFNYIDFNKANTLPLLDNQKYSDQMLALLLDFQPECLQTQTTFNNREQAAKSWITNTLIPEAVSFDGELNRVLLKAYNLEGKVIIRCDYSTLPELQDDILKQAQALNLMPLTMNQKLVALGYEPSTDPIADQLMIPAGTIPSDQYQNELASMNQNPNNDYPSNDNNADN